MNPAEFSIHNRVLSVIVILLVISGGWIAFKDMPRFEDPEFTIRTALVLVSYPGASPVQTAEEVTKALERAIQQMPEVEDINSVTGAGVVEIAVDIKYDFSKSKSDLNLVWTKLRNKVSDAARSLPPGVQPPIVYDDFGDVFGLYYFLTADGYSMAELYRYAKQLQTELLQIQDVAKVSIDGALSEAIYVEIARERAATLGVSKANIYQTLAQQNVSMPAGEVTIGERRLLVEPSGAIDSVEAIENLLVTTSGDGSIVYLSDIARVSRGYQTPYKKFYRYSGKPSISLGISGISGGNIVKIGEQVEERIARSESRRPIGIELHEFYHQGKFVETSVKGFLSDVVVAVLIVIVTLLLFMGLRPAAVMGTVLLLTVLATLAIMYASGIPMHRISLGALVIGLGMMVDNAIVVTDGIYVGVQAGKKKLEIAKSIIDQVKWPLLGGTLVGIIAFAPIGFAPGAAAEYVGHLFWVILIALGVSWLFAVTLTPLFCYWMFKEDAALISGRVDKESAFIRAYKRWVTVALRMRMAVLLGTVGLFVASVWGFQFVKPGFFPASTMPIFVLDYWLPQGTDISTTEKDILEIEQFAAGLDGVNAVATSIGGGNQRFTLIYPPESPNSSFAQLIIRVDDHRLIDLIMPEVQAHVDRHYPDAQSKVWKFQLGPAGGSKIEAKFSGPDTAVLRGLADQAKRIMADDGGALFIKDDWRQSVAAIEPIYSPIKGRRAGVSREQMADALQMVYSGKPVGVYREGDDLLPIIARSPESERRQVEDMRSVQVFSATQGRVVPLGQVTDGFRTVWRNGLLRREDRVWTIKAQSDPYPGEFASELLERIRPSIEAIELPDGYELDWGGEYGDSRKANENLASVLPLGFIAMVITVFVLFGTVRQPIIIWLVVPLALIGVVVGLVVTGLPLEFMGILGLISLSGLLIKNAIVLVDQTDVEIKAGTPRFDAVVEAAARRVRPVLLAALTMLGVVPLLFDPFFESMSVVLLFGLAFATILTLIVVPVLYALFFGIKSDEVRHESSSL